MDGLRPVFGGGDAVREGDVEVSALAPHGWTTAMQAALLEEAALLAADGSL